MYLIWSPIFFHLILLLNNSWLSHLSLYHLICFHLVSLMAFHLILSTVSLMCFSLILFYCINFFFICLPFILSFLISSLLFVTFCLLSSHLSLFLFLVHLISSSLFCCPDSFSLTSYSTSTHLIFTVLLTCFVLFNLFCLILSHFNILVCFPLSVPF